MGRKKLDEPSGDVRALSVELPDPRIPSPLQRMTGCLHTEDWLLADPQIRQHFKPRTAEDEQRNKSHYWALRDLLPALTEEAA